MINFKSKFLFGFSTKKYFIIIIIALFSLFGKIFFILSLISTLIISSLFIISKLYTLKLNFRSIFQFIGIYISTSIAFIVIQSLFLLIIFLIFTIFSVGNNSPIVISSILNMLLLIFILFFSLGIIFFELAKIIGLLNYWKTNKIENLFDINLAKNILFSNKFGPSFIFLVGYFTICLIIFTILLFLLDSINILSVNLIYFLIILLISFLNSGTYIIIYNNIKNRKLKSGKLKL